MAKKAAKAAAKPDVSAPDAGYPSSVRLPADMRKALEASATKRGRSLAAEMLSRLTNSLDDDERFGDLESQMFGRLVGSTIRLHSNIVSERKRKAGDREFAEWWREASDRADMREKIIDAIEAQLGKSDQRVVLPDELRERIEAWISETPKAEFKPSFLQAVFQLVDAGLKSDPARKLRWNI